MGLIKDKFYHLLEYAGIQLTNYSESTATIDYDLNDTRAYYLNQYFKDEQNLTFDSNGIPIFIYRGKQGYFPTIISMYGLAHFETYRKHGSVDSLLKFRKMADWFVEHQEANGVWMIDYEVKKLNLLKPWTSSLLQGMAISVLARAFLIYGDGRYAESARKGLLPFRIDIVNGGVTSTEDGKLFFEEYPSPKGYHVLNGFIITLWGLLDLVRIFDDSEAKALYDAGMETLIDWLPRFDIGYWSLYNISKDKLRNPASIPYHRLHIDQLNIMHQITGEEIFRRYYDIWSGYLDNPLCRLRSLPEKVLWNLVHGL